MDVLTIETRYRLDLENLVDSYHGTEMTEQEFFTKLETLKACRDWAIKLCPMNTLSLED